MSGSGATLLPTLGRIGSNALRGSCVSSSWSKPLVAQRPAIRCFATSPIRLRTASSDVESEKLYGTADEAVADLKSGSTILSAGFGLCGTAGELLHFLGMSCSIALADSSMQRRLLEPLHVVAKNQLATLLPSPTMQARLAMVVLELLPSLDSSTTSFCRIWARTRTLKRDICRERFRSSYVHRDPWLRG